MIPIPSWEDIEPFAIGYGASLAICTAYIKAQMYCNGKSDLDAPVAMIPGINSIVAGYFVISYTFRSIKFLINWVPVNKKREQANMWKTLGEKENSNSSNQR